MALSTLLLASCNTPETNSSAPMSAPESSVLPEISSSEEGMSKDTALLYFLRKLMKPANTTMSVKDPSGKTVVKYYMGEKAIVFDSNGEQEGILVNGEQGCFQFDIDRSNNVVLGQSYGRYTNVIDAFFTPALLSNEKEILLNVEMKGIY